ncbi:unnamed protein product [Hermetia illucens]|uniref:Uncharacterized protein n=1 Tax=Hermetia illucens TaxID=343691 RepID=A0A7R8YXW2_HERIL|nr:unnamed protein product [Hermetia illucens]
MSSGIILTISILIFSLAEGEIYQNHLSPHILHFPRETDTVSAYNTLRSKKSTVATICVEINPGRNGEEPYYMCKGKGLSTPTNHHNYDYKNDYQTPTNPSYPSKYPANNKAYSGQGPYGGYPTNTGPSQYSPNQGYKNSFNQDPGNHYPTYEANQNHYSKPADMPRRQDFGSGFENPSGQPGHSVYQGRNDPFPTDYNQPPVQTTNHFVEPHQSFPLSPENRNRNPLPNLPNSSINNQFYSNPRIPDSPLNEPYQQSPTDDSKKEASSLPSSLQYQRKQYTSTTSSAAYSSPHYPSMPTYYPPYPIVIPTFIPQPQSQCCVPQPCQQQCPSYSTKQCEPKNYLGSVHSSVKSSDGKQETGPSSKTDDLNSPGFGKTNEDHIDKHHLGQQHNQPERINLNSGLATESKNQHPHFDNADKERTAGGVTEQKGVRPGGSLPPALIPGRLDDQSLKEMEGERKRTDTLMRMSQMARNHTKSVDAANNAAEVSPLSSSDPSAGESKTIKKSIYSYDW